MTRIRIALVIGTMLALLCSSTPAQAEATGEPTVTDDHPCCV